MPDPIPLAPLVTVTHADPLEAVQLQVDDVVTVTAPVPPPAGSVALVGEMVKEHGVAACVKVNVCPAIVIVPVRDVVAVFAATLKFTEPPPLPLDPDVIVSQASFETAVQLQPVPELTVTVPVAAAELARFDEVGEIVNMQGEPACVTVNVWPAIVRVPVRDVAPVLAPTLYVTVPSPVPFAPAVTDSHPVFVVAVHVQPALAVTVTVPVVAPGEVKSADVGEIENEHGVPA